MEQIIQKLNIISDMADPHIQTLIKVLIEYIDLKEEKPEIGFKTKNEKNTNP